MQGPLPPPRRILLLSFLCESGHKGWLCCMSFLRTCVLWSTFMGQPTLHNKAPWPCLFIYAIWGSLSVQIHRFLTATWRAAAGLTVFAIFGNRIGLKNHNLDRTGFILDIGASQSHCACQGAVKETQPKTIKSGPFLTSPVINWDANTILNRFCNPSFKLRLWFNYFHSYCISPIWEQYKDVCYETLSLLKYSDTIS